MMRLLHRLGQGLASRGRNLTYRMLGVDLRDYCWLRAVEIPRIGRISHCMAVRWIAA